MHALLYFIVCFLHLAIHSFTKVLSLSVQTYLIIEGQPQDLSEKYFKLIKSINLSITISKIEFCFGRPCMIFLNGEFSGIVVLST